MIKTTLLFFVITCYSCNEKTGNPSKINNAENVALKTDTVKENNFNFQPKQQFSDSEKIELLKKMKARNEYNFLPMTKLSDSSKLQLMKNIQQAVLTADHFIFTDTIELENEEFMENMTDGGGSITGYFINGKLIKIKVWVGLSWGVTQDIYYFKNEKLQYVLETEDGFFVDSNGTDHSKFQNHFAGNFYFENNKMFDYVTLGHNRFENDENDPEKEFLENEAYYRKLILDKRKKVN